MWNARAQACWEIARRMSEEACRELGGDDESTVDGA